MENYCKVSSTHTPMPVVAGILSVIAGGLGLTAVFTPIISHFFTVPIANPQGYHFFIPYGWLGITFLVAGLISIIGGILACVRKYWYIAVAGAITSIFPIFLLGIPVIILIFRSKKEFA